MKRGGKAAGGGKRKDEPADPEAVAPDGGARAGRGPLSDPRWPDDDAAAPEAAPPGGEGFAIVDPENTPGGGSGWWQRRRARRRGGKR